MYICVLVYIMCIEVCCVNKNLLFIIFNYIVNIKNLICKCKIIYIIKYFVKIKYYVKKMCDFVNIKVGLYLKVIEWRKVYILFFLFEFLRGKNCLNI